MNVALIVPGFSASEEDWCIPALLDFVRTLAMTDRVRVFALRYPDTHEPYDVFTAHVVPLAGRQRAGLRRYPLLARAVSAVTHEHATEPFDIIHAIWADEPGWVGAAAANRLGLPLVVSLWGGELEHRPEQEYGAQRSWFGRMAVSRALRRADCWTVGSRYLMARVLERVSGIDPARGVLAPAGVDLQLFSPATKLKLGPTTAGPTTAGPSTTTDVGPSFSLVSPIILSVASLTRIKNLDLLVRAFRLVHDRRLDAQLHLVGEGPLREALERERDDLGLRAHVVFHGALRRETLPDWYRRAAVTVVASHHESQCLAAVEAAACGCPVVGFPVGILPELGPGAHPVSSRSASALASAILRLLDDTDARRRTGLYARAAAEDLFDLEQSVLRIRGIYADAFARRPRRAATMSA